ncbi:MAG TPA: hypothetical protein PLD88_07825 [Candidatus Berkiella sp.]|nr:hypothetical protein [Candidatus Berkiella sp.]
MIQAPIFHQPFNPELYHNITQPLFIPSGTIPISGTPVTTSCSTFSGFSPSTSHNPSSEEHHRGGGILSMLKKLSVSSRSERSDEKRNKGSKKTELSPGGAPLLPAPLHRKGIRSH